MFWTKGKEVFLSYDEYVAKTEVVADILFKQDCIATHMRNIR